MEFLESEPEVPEEFEYLLDWAKFLHGRSGAHMSGALPLSPEVAISWSTYMGLDLHPLELEALLLLDGALLGHHDEEEEKDA